MSSLAQTYPQLACQLADTGWGSASFSLVRRSYDLAASLFTAQERGSGKPLIDHVVGTSSGVLLGDGGPAAVAAALLHAAYDLGDSGDGRTGARPRHRRRLREIVGDEVEDLVHRYHLLGWSPDVLARVVADPDAADRRVLLIRVANEIDDACDGGLVLSGKGVLREHTDGAHEQVVLLAERIGTPALAAVAREVLLAPAPELPAALVIGATSTSTRLPASARRRALPVLRRCMDVTVRRAARGIRRRRTGSHRARRANP